MGNSNVTTHMNSVVKTIEGKMDKAVALMATDIHRQATILSPVDTGALRSSGMIERTKPAEYEVKFGSSRVPYAKRRHFENRKNPQTLRYLSRAGDATARNVSRYIRSVE